MGQNKKSIANRATDGVRTTSVGGSTAVSSEVLLILTNITVTGPNELIVGNQGTAVASGYMVGGTVPGITEDTPVPVAAWVWSSSNPNVATVNASTGVITAVASGSVTISVVAQGTSSPVGVLALPVVTPTPFLQSITVTPSNVSLNVGGSQTFAATGNYTDGTQATPTPLVWDFSSGTTYASINSVTGVVTGVASFNTVIVRATSGNTAGTVQMAVYSSATTSQGYVPLFSVDWDDYSDTTAAISQWEGTVAPFNANLGGYFDGYALTLQAESGTSLNWRYRAYSLVPDTTFGKAMRAGQWGRDEFTSLAAVNASQSCPTCRVTVTMPSTVSVYWDSRWVRFGKATDHPSGVRGWTVDNDGSSHYKFLGNEYSNAFAGSGSIQWRAEIDDGVQFKPNPNNGSATETLMSNAAWRVQAGYPHVLTQPISATSNMDGWWNYRTCFIRTSAQTCYIGFFVRKGYYLDGTPLSSPTTTTPASYNSLAEGDWRGLIYRYTGANVPNGVARFGIGFNMNGRIDYTQYMYFGPIEVVDGSQYPDPYGMLAMFGVTAV